MPDIIQLLPDSVANQIAAGEVVQRPASAVKELLENAVDAGANEITLIIKDAGKTLMQVIDNGKGMSPTDARLSFERHATSKIKKAEDLFDLHTKGFRGEALASIAAVASVELKTRQEDQELGTSILIEGSEVKSQEPSSTAPGTSIAVKNLFYNIPARRNFLKSDPVEYNHIIEEFIRVALPHPDIVFKLYNNNTLIYHLEKGNVKQRIVALFGNNYSERLVPVEENTTVIRIRGYIGKPEFAKKTRGEQYMFVNNRFIKNGYLHHAISDAYKQVLSEESYPSYFLFFDVDPAKIDINIHPTKTEIKFEEEKVIYSILKAAIKLSLGQYNIAPSLDFDAESVFAIDFSPSKEMPQPPTINVNPDYNPFAPEVSKPSAPSSKAGGSYRNDLTKHRNTDKWEDLYAIAANEKQEEIPQQAIFSSKFDEEDSHHGSKYLQLSKKFIVTSVGSGLLLIDQKAAHERVLYEKYIYAIANNKISTQQLLFPQTVSLNHTDYLLVKELMDAFKMIGFDVEDFGSDSVIIHGVPALVTDENINGLLEQVLETFKTSQTELKNSRLDILARAMARNTAIKHGRHLHQNEMQALADDLFACEINNVSPFGEKIMERISLAELENKFK